MITPPSKENYAPFYETYISKLSGQDPMRLLGSLILDFKALLSEVPDEKEEYCYAEGKWSVKEVVGHMIDVERIMACRALCIARGEKQSIPGFDEDEYVKVANFNKRSLYDLAHEYGFVRESTLALFKTFSEEDLDRVGTANNYPVSARAILYIIAGHHLHHQAVLKEKYLPELL